MERNGLLPSAEQLIGFSRNPQVPTKLSDNALSKQPLARLIRCVTPCEAAPRDPCGSQAGRFQSAVGTTSSGGWCDGRQAQIGSCGTTQVAVAGATGCGRARDAPGVLVADRDRSHERNRRRTRRRLDALGVTLIPAVRWHACSSIVVARTAVVRAAFVAHGAGRADVVSAAADGRGCARHLGRAALTISANCVGTPPRRARTAASADSGDCRNVAVHQLREFGCTCTRVEARLAWRSVAPRGTAIREPEILRCLGTVAGSIGAGRPPEVPLSLRSDS